MGRGEDEGAQVQAVVLNVVIARGRVLKLRPLVKPAAVGAMGVRKGSEVFCCIRNVLVREQEE